MSPPKNTQCVEWSIKHPKEGGPKPKSLVRVIWSRIFNLLLYNVLGGKCLWQYCLHTFLTNFYVPPYHASKPVLVCIWKKWYIYSMGWVEQTSKVQFSWSVRQRVIVTAIDFTSFWARILHSRNNIGPNKLYDSQNEGNSLKTHLENKQIVMNWIYQISVFHTILYFFLNCKLLIRHFLSII